jgi:hypothetical protein
MPVGQECTTGEPPEPRYAFYDKSKDAKNNGWVWFHRELLLDDIVRFYRDHFQGYFGNGVPDGRGFVRFDDSLVLYQYSPVGKDDKGRDHWVLLMAWLPASVETAETWKVLDNEVFQHVASGKCTLPEQLSVFDYHAEIAKLTYAGAKAVVASDKARLYIENIRRRGAVNITFYWEKPDGKAIIETQKKNNS